MIDKDTYQNELVRMWDSVRNCSKGLDKCHGVDCKECPIHGFKYGCSSPLSAFEIYEAVEKWSKEHPKQKYKVSQLECDILEAFIDYGFVYYFYDSNLLMSLLRSGYFQGATSEMDIRNYFNDCEIA